MGAEPTTQIANMSIDISGQQLGIFDLHDLRVFGELYLAASQSRLTLRTEENADQLKVPNAVHGQLHDFTFVSCVDCKGGSVPSKRFGSKGQRSYSWDVFPHFIFFGNRHFNPINDKIVDVWFSVSDASLIFDDFDSYGILDTSSVTVSDLIQESVGDRQIPLGPAPTLAYFGGRCDVLKVEVSEGSIVVQHWPISEMGSSEGIRIRSQLKLGVRFRMPTELSVCIEAVTKLAQFLSLVAGRSQGVSNVQVKVNGASEKERFFSVYWSLAPSISSTEGVQYKPSFLDMPLDAIRRPEEFKESLSAWWEAPPSHKLARARLHACRSRGIKFDVDRLVAAANMFDLRVICGVEEQQHDLIKVCTDCIKALKRLPKTYDRDSIIMALSRVGTPSLRKKILMRADIVKSRFVLDNLDEVLGLAVKCRNYFVHGDNDSSFNFATVKPFTTFFTETLEFVFAAAELIECGWNSVAWKNGPHTASHWFYRYLNDYSKNSRDLLLASNNKKSKIDLPL